MKKTLLAGLAVGMMMLGVAGVASATTMFSDNFESDSVGLNKYNFINWTVSDGSVDLIGTGTSWNWFPSYGKYVDMDGSTGDAGIMLSKNITLSAGDYFFQFDLAGNQRGAASDTVNVLVKNGIFSDTISLLSGDEFRTYSQSFSLLSTTTVAISFEGVGGDNIGMLLDNVLLERIDHTPVPEPATMLLMGTGLTGLVAARRKQKAA